MTGFAQTLPIKDEFNGSALNTNIWSSYNSDSSFTVQGGKLHYLTSATNNGNNDSVLILKDPISLAKSWEVSFFITQGDTPVIYPNPNGGIHNAFRKFGFVFINPNNTNVIHSIKFYDEGTNRFPYSIYEGQFFMNSNQLVTTGGTNQLTLYSWQSNSWYARTSKVTATWTAPTLQLKVKIEDTENYPSPGVKGFQFAAAEAGDLFYESAEQRASNVVIGIIMKSAYQTCSISDNFALERVCVSEGMDINLLSSSNLAPALSSWSTNQIFTQPKSDGAGFFKITPR